MQNSNPYESEITLVSSADEETLGKIAEKLHFDSLTYFQFYFALASDDDTGFKQKTKVSEELIPTLIKEKLEKYGITLSTLESCRIRYCPEKVTWEMTIKEKEEPQMKVLRKTIQGKKGKFIKKILPSVIRKEHVIPLESNDIQELTKMRSFTGIVIKKRFNLLPLLSEHFRGSELPLTLTLDTINSPHIQIDNGLPQRYSVRLEAEFLSPESMVEFQRSMRKKFLKILNRCLKQAGLKFGTKKLHGQKLMALATGKLLESNGISVNKIVENLYENSQKMRDHDDTFQAHLPTEIFDAKIDESHCLPLVPKVEALEE